MRVEDEIRVINTKVEKLENEVQKIHKTLNEQSKEDIRTAEVLKSLENQIISVKQDVVKTLEDNSRRTWDLINKGIKVICVLVFIVCCMAGVKLLPDIFNILGGI